VLTELRSAATGLTQFDAGYDIGAAGSVYCGQYPTSCRALDRYNQPDRGAAETSAGYDAAADATDPVPDARY
jgi:hypothetical protein